ncbi:DgyrCDS11240 [Dimorphilus gyrociliatus]|uniref:DgyrCDS11240 n=1 Tax=Dimorphilus gyrociliatus TaxID=2664684 RepID=A0A7I8W3R5_9ANNE|nr:DgyrCDS11240 [Dimorphilus gyrociliatus]
MEKSLEDILYAFNAPLSEEQAWAVCHQCLIYLIKVDKSYRRFRGLNSVIIGPNGNVVRIKGDEDGSEKEVTKCLGALVYQTIDWGLSEEESNEISPELTFLIEELIRGDDSFEKDEGIDTEESPSYFSLSSALKICKERHVEEHYKAVCRAIITEANELSEFLDKISNESVDELNRTDWAKLWIQLMKELRMGVKLKSIEIEKQRNCHYELTPYEILMADIRDKRYHLNKIMVNGDIPQHASKTDARSVIMDFIRSRPPLKPAGERVLKPKKSPKLLVREELMQQIKRGVSLKTTPSSKLAIVAKKNLKKIEPIDFVDFEDWESEDDLDENDLVEERDCQTPTMDTDKYNIEEEIEKKLTTLRPKRKLDEEENSRPNSLNLEDKRIEKECAGKDYDEKENVENCPLADNEKNNNDFREETPKNNKIKLIVSDDLLQPLTPLSPNGGNISESERTCRKRELRKRHSLTAINFTPKFSVNLPLEHFSRIPAYTLGPSSSLRYPVENHYGSAPNSPERGRKLPFVTDLLNHISAKRSKVPICIDCKDLVFQIVKASRNTLYTIGNSSSVPFADHHDGDLIGTI